MSRRLIPLLAAVILVSIAVVAAVAEGLAWLNEI